MKELINNFKAIHYARLADIISLDINPAGTVTLNGSLHKLDIGHGSIGSITRNPTDSGLRYTTSLNIVLKSQLLIKDQIILVITLSDAEMILIGDIDLPVSYSEAHQLAGKGINVEHISHRYPPSVTLSDGAGTGSGSGSAAGGL